MAINFSSKEYTKRFHPDDARCCRVECVCACSGILFFLPLISFPESRFGRYWANQGLLILLAELTALMIGGVISWMLDLLALIPLIGIVFTILKIAVAIAFFLVIFIFAIRAGRFAAKGRAVDLPIIGYLRFIK
jgi:uncharacterized membrane protein